MNNELNNYMNTLYNMSVKELESLLERQVFTDNEREVFDNAKEVFNSSKKLTAGDSIPKVLNALAIYITINNKKS